MSEIFDPLLEARLFKEAEVSVQFVDVETGEEAWSYGEDQSLAPASVMKVLTAATALHTIGPAYRFKTEFLTDGEVGNDGILEGDLYVRGTGDPTLVVEKLWKMLRDLEVAGVTEIEGDVVLDASFFDDDHLVAGWRKKVDLANGPAYFAPVGALSLNYNTTCVVVAPGGEPGEPARVELDTPASAITVENEMTTGRPGTRYWIELEREVEPTHGTVIFRVKGSIPEDGDVNRYYRSVGHPTPHFASALEHLMAERRIRVNGRWRKAETPDDADLLVSLRSPPLAEILNHTNKFSSNFMAEHVLKTVGAEVHGTPGTTAKGLTAVGDYLGGLGIEAPEYTLVNGSGLSRDLRLRPSHVNAVLIDMWHAPLVRPEFLSSLSVAGVDGTLRRRFSDSPGAVRGKTGSLNGVVGLTSYMKDADGRVYAMSFFANGQRRNRPARDLQDRFGERLLEWSAREARAKAEPTDG